MGAQMQRGAYSRVCGASTAFRPVAVGVGGAERGAPMSQSAYRRVCGAATPKGAAQRGCSATGPATFEAFPLTLPSPSGDEGKLRFRIALTASPSDGALSEASLDCLSSSDR